MREDAHEETVVGRAPSGSRFECSAGGALVALTGRANERTMEMLGEARNGRGVNWGSWDRLLGPGQESSIEGGSENWERQIFAKLSSS